MKKQYLMPSVECNEVTMAQVLCASAPLIITDPMEEVNNSIDIG